MISRTIGILFAGLLFLVNGAAVQSASLTNSDIAGIVDTAAGISAKNAQLALQKTQNGEVKAFATKMLREHEGLQQNLASVLARESATSTISPTAKKMLNEALGQHDRLVKMSGAAFDRAYLDNEISFHKSMVARFENELIPSARSPMLKDFLVTSLPTCKMHEQQAEELLTTLKTKNARL